MNMARGGTMIGATENAFFTESEEYWQPGTECEVIYKQLASYKYRELTHGLIQ